MTKFEEEFEQELDYFIERELSLDEKLSFGARDVLVKFFSGWYSPGHIEKEIQMKLLKLQQQALPVVPEFVGIAIESLPDDYSAFEAISLINAKIHALPEENKDWLPVYNWLREDVKNQDIFALAFITGKYQVEKPQLFYLKNKLTTSYLALDINTGYYEHWGEEIIPKLLNKQGYKLSFTQAEIDSMQTGSYEQIEVAE